MPLVSMRPLLEDAEKRNYAVGAFNVNNMEQAQGIMNSAIETKSPFIYQVSKGALQYSDKEILVDIIKRLINKHSHIPVAIHLDHGTSPELCQEAIELGFTSVMMDGSLLADGKTPSDIDYNINVTKQVVDFARDYTKKTGIDITVEGEIGNLKGLEDGVGTEEEKITNPEDAKRLYEATSLDALAIAWGTSHGAYKGVKGKPPKLRPDIVEACHRLVPEVYLVSHGSSSVPQNLVDRVNSYGVYHKYTDKNGHRHIRAFGRDFNLDETDKEGNKTNAENLVRFLFENDRMPQSVGVPMEKIQEAIKLGMRKINVDTDGRMAVTSTILKVFEEKPSEFDPRKYLGPARDSIKNDFAENAMIKFGSAGRI